MNLTIFPQSTLSQDTDVKFVFEKMFAKTPRKREPDTLCFSIGNVSFLWVVEESELQS